MKLHAVIADYQTDIEIRDDGGVVFAEIDGRRYELDVHESGRNGYVLNSNGQVFSCRVEGRPDSGKEIDVIVGTTSYPIVLTDPKRLSGAALASAHGDDAARIVAPMAGTVIALNIQTGATVNGGDVLAVVE